MNILNQIKKLKAGQYSISDAPLPGVLINYQEDVSQGQITTLIIFRLENGKHGFQLFLGGIRDLFDVKGIALGDSIIISEDYCPIRGRAIPVVGRA